MLPTRHPLSRRLTIYGSMKKPEFLMRTFTVDRKHPLGSHVFPPEKKKVDIDWHEAMCKYRDHEQSENAMLSVVPIAPALWRHLWSRDCSFGPEVQEWDRRPLPPYDVSQT